MVASDAQINALLVARQALATIDEILGRPAERDLITLKAAAFRFRKHETTVRRWARDGLGVLRGGQWLLDADLVEKRGVR